MLRELGKRLKLERERLGLAPSELAEAMGVDKSSLYGYERGDRSTPSIHLAAFVKMGADPAFLLSGRRLAGAEKTSLAAAEDIVDAVLHLAAMSHWDKLTGDEKKETAMEFVLRGGRIDTGAECDVA